MADKPKTGNRVRIRFLKVWGHPTKDEIYGPSSGVVEVSEWAADQLIRTGYAVRVSDEASRG